MKNPENKTNVVDALSGIKTMVIGDVMVDSYLWGKVDRISPEAPVPIVHISKREMRPGGAANVALNIRSLGAEAILCSVTGSDRYGHEFIQLLEKEGLSTKGILQMTDRTTTVKTRVIGNNHQLIRVDDEMTDDLSAKQATDFCKHVIALMKSEKPVVIILEDYDKGVLSADVIIQIINAANENNIPITADPKKKNFNTYKSLSLFKPNLAELRSGLKKDIEELTAANLQEATSVFFTDRKIKLVMVTLSEAGVFVSNGIDSKIFPAHVRNISDVSGAGDTVISVASLCLAAGYPMETIAELSNLAGGLVCEQVGVIPVDREKLRVEAATLQKQVS